MPSTNDSTNAEHPGALAHGTTVTMGNSYKKHNHNPSPATLAAQQAGQAGDARLPSASIPTAPHIMTVTSRAAHAIAPASVPSSSSSSSSSTNSLMQNASVASSAPMVVTASTGGPLRQPVLGTNLNANSNGAPPQASFLGKASDVIQNQFKSNAAKLGGRWGPEEDNILRQTVAEMGAKNWKKISQVAFGGRRTDVQCLHRWQKVLKPGLVKGSWTKEEDAVVMRMVEKYGLGNIKWSVIANQLPGRLGKQCRERWFNHLDPSLKKEPWSAEEDRILMEAQSTLGNRWCQIASLIPGRSENAVKNRWNSAMRRKLQSDRAERGPDPEKEAEKAAKKAAALAKKKEKKERKEREKREKQAAAKRLREEKAAERKRIQAEKKAAKAAARKQQAAAQAAAAAAAAAAATAAASSITSSSPSKPTAATAAGLTAPARTKSVVPKSATAAPPTAAGPKKSKASATKSKSKKTHPDFGFGTAMMMSDGAFFLGAAGLGVPPLGHPPSQSQAYLHSAHDIATSGSAGNNSHMDDSAMHPASSSFAPSAFYTPHPHASQHMGHPSRHVDSAHTVSPQMDHSQQHQHQHQHHVVHHHHHQSQQQQQMHEHEHEQQRGYRDHHQHQGQHQHEQHFSQHQHMQHHQHQHQHMPQVQEHQHAQHQRQEQDEGDSQRFAHHQYEKANSGRSVQDMDHDLPLASPSEPLTMNVDQSAPRSARSNKAASDKHDEGFMHGNFHFESFPGSGSQSFFSSHGNEQTDGPAQTPTQHMSAADAFWPELSTSLDFPFGNMSQPSLVMHAGGANTRSGNLVPPGGNKSASSGRGGTKGPTKTKAKKRKDGTAKATKAAAGSTKKAGRKPRAPKANAANASQESKAQSLNQPIDFDLFTMNTFGQADDLFGGADPTGALDPSATVHGDDSSNLLEDLSFLNMTVDYSDGRKYRDDGMAGDGAPSAMPSMMDQFDDLFQSM
ncbi:Transcription factor MYB3R-4 [Hondaea fermentalgiana]|uniref:Transcription factor MYB3R-4 n=1 Tax=Hondaea fermentalgiana TaxID=2315210 RepID=A0A2R5GD16_9STRA|nr:Transcription factor MYB3R-4 [Hondaea fermentalgiana]|eukprot:GBG27598.1 Transcription factor MYB3R-4 [Hondaea fermentalgiana]